MKKVLVSSLITVLFFGLAFSNSVPSAIWPQKDIAAKQVGNSLSKKRILIAAVSSPFKDSVINAFSDSLVKDSIYVKIVGMKKLSKENAADWNKVIIVNTCMAWQMDNRVQNFLKKNKDYKGFIVFTTSGDPKECSPADKIPKGIDTISSASVEDKKEAVVKQLLESVRKR